MIFSPFFVLILFSSGKFVLMHFFVSCWYIFLGACLEKTPGFAISGKIVVFPSFSQFMKLCDTTILTLTQSVSYPDTNPSVLLPDTCPTKRWIPRKLLSIWWTPLFFRDSDLLRPHFFGAFFLSICFNGPGPGPGPAGPEFRNPDPTRTQTRLGPGPDQNFGPVPSLLAGLENC